MRLLICLAIVILVSWSTSLWGSETAKRQTLDHLTMAEGRSFFPIGAVDGQCGKIETLPIPRDVRSEPWTRQNTVRALDLDCVIAQGFSPKAENPQVIEQYLLVAGLIIASKPERSQLCDILGLIDLKAAKDARFPDAFYVVARINLYLEQYDQVVLNAETAVDLGLNEAQPTVDWAVRRQIAGDHAGPTCPSTKR